MAHPHNGDYSRKHSAGRKAKPRLVEALEKRAKNNSLTCAAAHKLSSDSGETPAEVGFSMDLMGIRITQCQLGLFGYVPEKKIVKPSHIIDANLKQALEKETVNRRLPCKTAWDLSDKLGIEKLAVSSACEELGIKISHCQLGAF